MRASPFVEFTQTSGFKMIVRIEDISSVEETKFDEEQYAIVYLKNGLAYNTKDYSQIKKSLLSDYNY